LGGILFNQLTKGGGDKFHGSVYKYFQNDALNAADYSLTGNKNKVAFSATTTTAFPLVVGVMTLHHWTAFNFAWASVPAAGLRYRIVEAKSLCPE
jgi:hypothetical protein